MDHNLFSHPNWDSPTYSQPEAGSEPVMPSAVVCQQAEAPNAGSQAGGGLWLPRNTVPVGSVNRNLSVLFCCSACVISRTAALAGCIGQKLVRENPWQGAPRCHVTNVATAGFLLSYKKFTWSVHMGCHSPTNASMVWCGPDSWLIDWIHCLGKRTYETWQAV